ncbi:MAG: hypothetical protein LH613_02335 [Chamaesiphon sp.]|nr:hypothetical protein [Chamaesiphon sp.]
MKAARPSQVGTAGAIGLRGWLGWLTNPRSRVAGDPATPPKRRCDWAMLITQIHLLTSCTDTQVLLLPQPMGTHKGHPYGLIV